MAEVKDTKAIRQALRGSLESGMRSVVEDLAGRAIKEAPVKEGTLRASANPSVEVHGNEVTGRVTFALPYAEAQHEHLEFQHPRGGKAKYLEGPLTDMAPRYAETLGKIAKRAING